MCEKLNYVAPRRKKDGKHEMACTDMKKARKSCRLFISFCKMKLFVRKKKLLYMGFEPRTPLSQFLRYTGTAIETRIHCGLSISYEDMRWSRFHVNYRTFPIVYGLLAIVDLYCVITV